jgi:SAM-dependent methyltransferase
VTDPTRRFSSRADDYARYRPSYPAAALDLLTARCGLTTGTVVADVGSGTGILTGLLLERGAEVFAVEPNPAMRAAAEERLGGQPRFHSVSAAAEATTLAAASVSLWVAGQAFHWFDVERSRAEALRLLKAGGWAAMLWNERPERKSAFLLDYEAQVLRHAAEYQEVSARRAQDQSMRRFFGGDMECVTFPNEQLLDFAGLRGRLMSSSYAPEAGHPAHEPMLASLREVFERHAQGGRVLFGYRTLVYFRQLKPA